jgi:hypothetical protein
VTETAAPVCEVCAYADEHGDWVDAIPGLTHCRRCHGSWSQRSELQHCTACCRTFTSETAADIHRGPEGCRDPAELRTAGGRLRLAISQRRPFPGTTVTIWGKPGPSPSTESPEANDRAPWSASGRPRGQGPATAASSPLPSTPQSYGHHRERPNREETTHE